MTGPNTPISDLSTIRDCLLYGIDRFDAAGLVYGHGTANAADEAAFLILKVLQLPVDELESRLDVRLTRHQRTAVLDILEKRIVTRKPAPYLVGEAWIQGHKFYVDERVIVPRSFIGELMCGGLELALPAGPAAIGRALDLCTGSGCLAILAALKFPNAAVDASDLSPGALAVAERNVAGYGLGGRVRLIHSDLFEGLAGERYDIILANPPYVRADEMAAFPPEHQAEPAIAHAGGDDGLDLVRKILAGAGRHLTDGGVLVVEVGTGGGTLEEQFPELPFLWLDTEESSGEVFVLPAQALQNQSRLQKAGRSKGTTP